ncbi:MAG: hypothetical protein ACI3ZI_08020 [Candidatus Cryptobacteroides sp.]
MCRYRCAAADVPLPVCRRRCAAAGREAAALQNRLASLDRLAPVARLLNPSQLTLTAPFRGTRPSLHSGRWLRCFGFLRKPRWRSTTTADAVPIAPQRDGGGRDVA